MLLRLPYISYNRFILALQGHEQLLISASEENKEFVNHEQAFSS